MEITAHGLWALIHGMGFGGLYLLSCSGAIAELSGRYAPAALALLLTFPPIADLF